MNKSQLTIKLKKNIKKLPNDIIRYIISFIPSRYHSMMSVGKKLFSEMSRQDLKKFLQRFRVSRHYVYITICPQRVAYQHWSKHKLDTRKSHIISTFTTPFYNEKYVIYAYPKPLKRYCYKIKRDMIRVNIIGMIYFAEPHNYEPVVEEV